ncbi:UNVERIFIED_CONTAM: hypothetical protein Sradi_3142300 [Sesamum radiatum]|uniref:Uncharacterized protein n=1 Tax=Sesamum radiatum TaxID=300843 RepID=A0AAW2REW1_SESRA
MAACAPTCRLASPSRPHILRKSLPAVLPKKRPVTSGEASQPSFRQALRSLSGRHVIFVLCRHLSMLQVDTISFLWRSPKSYSK